MLGTEYEVVTDTCVTYGISWKEQNAGPLLTPLSFTTALRFVPPTSMGTGVSSSLLSVSFIQESSKYNDDKKLSIKQNIFFSLDRIYMGLMNSEKQSGLILRSFLSSIHF